MDTFYFLIATLALVPLFKRLELGSMLGYIVAGILIGPMCLGLIDSSKSIVQLAELGITLLLFIVGLELSPARLKQLRKNIILEGGLQVTLTTLVFFFIGTTLGLSYQAAFLIGAALSLSSTAFALSHMTETSQLTLSHGQTSLSVLLFQDLLIVPLMAVVPLLATDPSSQQAMSLSSVAFKFGLFCSLILLCFFVLKPAISFIKKTQDPEISLAAFLFLMIGMAIGMEKIGLSMPMGSFITGAFLANTEIKTSIKSLTLPFKGILMGLFFMTLGINFDFNFISENLQQVALLSIGIILTKSIILIGIGRVRNGNFKTGIKVSLLISQAGEFGVVLMGSALHFNIIDTPVNKLVSTSILVTMIAAPFLVKMTSLIRNSVKTEEVVPEETPEVEETPNTSNVVPLKLKPVDKKKAA
ncbi:MAG: Kef-type K+ transport system membrane component KefB [Bacteriovoracaceae bacterium]|jgi:Kef-type K+ transport system membrane component KefB